MRNKVADIFTIKNIRKAFFLFSILIPTFVFSAPPFAPGETLNPGCLPTNLLCTVVSTTTVTHIYASSTFPSFDYGSSTYYLASNPAGYLTLSTDPWMMASSSYLATTSAAALYVPYIGATGDVDLGTNTIFVQNINSSSTDTLTLTGNNLVQLYSPNGLYYDGNNGLDSIQLRLDKTQINSNFSDGSTGANGYLQVYPNQFYSSFSNGSGNSGVISAQDTQFYVQGNDTASGNYSTYVTPTQIYNYFSNIDGSSGNLTINNGQVYSTFSNGSTGGTGQITINESNVYTSFTNGGTGGTGQLTINDNNAYTSFTNGTTNANGQLTISSTQLYSSFDNASGNTGSFAAQNTGLSAQGINTSSGNYLLFAGPDYMYNYGQDTSSNNNYYFSVNKNSGLDTYGLGWGLAVTPNYFVLKNATGTNNFFIDPNTSVGNTILSSYGNISIMSGGSGFVGIGTTTPNAALTVVSTSSQSIAFAVYGGTSIATGSTITMNTGNGSTSNNSFGGGDFNISTGLGGSAISGMAVDGGRGGNFSITLGNGAPGTGFGTAGRGGSYSLVAGDGASGWVGGAGGSISLSAGDGASGMGFGNPGSITLTAGDGGPIGGNILLMPGLAGYTGFYGGVGIGTTTPSTMLVVAGTSTLQDILPGGPYTGNMSPYSIGASTTRWLSVWAETVNIGTSTWSLKQTGDRFGIFNSANGGGTESFTILSNGNVGIGTTTPGSKLTIIGSSTLESLISNYLYSTDNLSSIEFTSASSASVYNDLVPLMTSATTPSGTTSVAVGTNQGAPSQVFDNNSGTFWQPNVPNAYVQYQFPTTQLVTGYQVTAADNGWPTAWSFEGSNDGSNWTVLDTKSGEVFTSGSTNSYQFVNANTYSYYKYDVTNHDPSDGLMKIAELVFSDPASETADISISTNQIERIRLFQSGVLAISASSKVGIGTSTPTANLTIEGTPTSTLLRLVNIGAGSLDSDASGNVINTSDERLKDIQGVYEKGLAEIKQLTPINYKWKTETGYDASTTYSGFSAQNVHDVLPEATGKNGAGFLTLNDRPIIAALVNAVKQIASFITKIENGIAYLTNIVVERFTVGSLEAPTGITMYDRTTKQPYCIIVDNGVMYNESGECQQASSTQVTTATVFTPTDTPTSTTTPSTTSTSTDTLAPIINILGLNPEELIVNQTYTDAGATATDDTDLLVTVSATGTVDTSTVGTYSISYTAVDLAGNIANAIRTINILAEPATSTPIVIDIATSTP